MSKSAFKNLKQIEVTPWHYTYMYAQKYKVKSKGIRSKGLYS